MLAFLYSFGKKVNGTWEKDELLDSIDDPTDVVVAIKEIVNIDNDKAISILDGFVDK